MKGIYRGPLHYWNQYSLVPREQYYYGYYGMYGPYTDLSKYEPVDEDGDDTVKTSMSVENFCGSNSSFGSILLCLVFAWLILRLFGIL